MSTKSFQYFMSRREFDDSITKVITSYPGIGVYGYAGSHRALVGVDSPVGLKSAEYMAATRVFIGDTTPTLPPPDAVVPGQLGWIVADRPRTQGSVLYLGTIAARSDWTDDEGVQHESEAAHRIYAQVSRIFKEGLYSPVFATNSKTGRSARYQDIWFSADAAAWERAGNQLKQEGVEGVSFCVAAPSA